jgi:N-acyl homoserine lactone hydrolase
MPSQREMRIDGYEIDILVHGFPGKSVCHGGLGWSTIVLLRGQSRTALVDAGSFGMRRLLIDRLAKHGLKPADVTDLLLTHAHHDHCVNWTLFRQARIVIGAHEMEAALQDPWGETPTPELYVRALKDWPTVQLLLDGGEALPWITARVTPGHTRGHLIFILQGAERDVIFTGDAAKNRAELVCREADLTYDSKISTDSINLIWELWRRRPGTILVPGHDLPMTQEDGVPSYLGNREAAITAWFGDNLETITTFKLTER